MVSCEDLDEGSLGAVTGDSYYADELSLEAGVTGVYGLLEFANWGVDVLAAYTGADDLSTHSGGNKWVFSEGDTFALTGGNSRLIGIWENYYRAINAANAFIEKAHPEGVDEAIVNNAHANVYFVRALLYFRLTTIFGDIPMPLSSIPDYEMEKTSSRAVLSQVISDLEYVEKWSTTARDTDVTIADGHATKTAARAFLAKTYMQLTGYPYNETDKWTQVKSYTKQIVDAGVYSLMDDYMHNFGEPWENNKETIFAHQFKLEAWPINTECRWYGAFWTNWMDMFLEWTFYDNFPEGYRKNATTSTISANAITYAHPVNTKLLYGTIQGTPEFVNIFKTNNDMPAMRYAEVLLMYAEACANTGSEADAINYLNMVKRRAYAGGVTTSKEVLALGAGFWENADASVDYTAADLSSTQAIIDAIVHERACEFVSEVGGNRWLDLVRLNKVGEVTALRDAREIPLVGDPSNKDLWYAPIPETEIDLNPNLK
ncbi:hypothetical protein BZG02_05335 [Labilibaculum filiforme]|uniref:RagB/SusD family nutrient uptake outer membrane protein n=2 Tax=Labilibaculum filiforme TaxID=1940526 RepID=A0A2N3I1R0_9BACT|nr:hypothetical protein BZG02_05335 [Labilibaculum filiforme]